MLGELSLFSHSTRNEQAKLFGGDHWPLNWAVTSWLCICKTLKRINIVMRWGFTGPQMNALLYARTFGSFISLRTSWKDKNMQISLPKHHLQEILFFVSMSKLTPQNMHGVTVTEATGRCVYEQSKLPHQSNAVMETTRGPLLFIAGSTLYRGLLCTLLHLCFKLPTISPSPNKS